MLIAERTLWKGFNRFSRAVRYSGDRVLTDFLVAYLLGGIASILFITGLVGVVISAIRGRRKMPWGIVASVGLILTAASGFLLYDGGKPAIEVDILEAVERGLIETSASGDGLDGVEVTLTSNSDDPLRVIINPGTVFAAQSPLVQNMVVIRGHAATLRHRHDSSSLNLLAACLNMLLDVPEEEDSLSISNASAADDIIKLLDLPGFYNQTLRVRQFSIWTITEDPARDEYMGIGTFWGTGPSDDEMLEILTLFERAEIDTSKYKALQDIG